MPPEIAIGMIILSACPGGIVSNVIVFSGKADTALSVTLTAINSLITVFSIPFVVQAGLIFVLGEGEAPDLPVLKLMGMLFGMTVFPVGLGMILGSKKPEIAERYEPFLRNAGTILIILFVIFAVLGEIDFVMQNLASVAPLALFFNLVMMTIGFCLAHIFSLELLQKITVSVEIGVQNNILAFLIALTILNNKQYMTFAAFYGILMMATAFGFLTYMRKTKIE
jgi:BASS family bile acid:Na+ symporter